MLYKWDPRGNCGKMRCPSIYIYLLVMDLLYFIALYHNVQVWQFSGSCLLLVALWSPPAEKELTCWLACACCFLVFLSLYRMVSRVRCGTWLYRFLILDFYFTSMVCFLCHANCSVIIHQHLILLCQRFRNIAIMLQFPLKFSFWFSIYMVCSTIRK